VNDAPTRIETARLELRAPDEVDVQPLYEAIEASLEDLRPWISWAQKMPTVEDLERVVANTRTWFTERETFVWRVYLKGTKTLIGEIDIHHLDWEVPKCEIGYWGRSDYTGQGYMSEAVSSVLQVAFEVLKMRRVEALCDSRNDRSIRLAERVGMVKEGLLRNYELDPFDQICDQVLLSMIPSDR
jgi:ribosomal-protein-serine acetyltransferase